MLVNATAGSARAGPVTRPLARSASRQMTVKRPLASRRGHGKIGRDLRRYPVPIRRRPIGRLPPIACPPTRRRPRRLVTRPQAARLRRLRAARCDRWSLSVLVYRHGLAPAPVARDAGPHQRAILTTSSPATWSARSRSSSALYIAGGRAVGAGRASFLTVAGGILFGALARRRRRDGRRDDRRHLHLPDRQERVRRASRAPRRAARGASSPRASAPTRSATSCSCGWCRCFRSGWSTWCRRLSACGLRPSWPRPRSASSRRPSRSPSSAPGSTA